MPGRGRGRCRGRRWVQELPQSTIDPTMNQIPPNSVCLTVEEVEILRLIDLEELTQETAAARMGISRKTFWNDLKRVRKKIAHAVFHGHPIFVAGGMFKLKNQTEVNNQDAWWR